MLIKYSSFRFGCVLFHQIYLATCFLSAPGTKKVQKFHFCQHTFFLSNPKSFIQICPSPFDSIRFITFCFIFDLLFLFTFFLKMGHFWSLFFFIFVFSIQLTVNKFIKFCRWLASNRGSLVSEATVATPTALSFHFSFPVFKWGISRPLFHFILRIFKQKYSLITNKCAKGVGALV